MGRKSDQDMFRAALLEYVALQEKTRETDLARGLAQERYNDAYKKQCEKGDEARKLWKKMQPHWRDHGHVQLPDGRIVTIQPGVILIDEPLKI